MDIKQGYIEALNKGLRSYLSNFKINGNPIMFSTEYESKEYQLNDYPMFYVGKYMLQQNKALEESGIKYEYDLETQKRKLRKRRYSVTFTLEYLDINPKIAMLIEERLERTFQITPFFMLEFADEKFEDCNFIVTDKRENTESQITHKYWVIQVNLLMDISFALEDAEIVLEVDVKEGEVN